MPVPNLKAAAAAAMSFALIAVPPAANAEDVRPKPVSASVGNQSNISYSSNARLDAGFWSEANPNGAAVAVYLGNSGDLSPIIIEPNVRRRFAQNGVTNVAFFYEQNDVPRTVFSLHQNGNGYGPMVAPEIGEQIDMVAGQVALRREYPELAQRR